MQRLGPPTIKRRGKSWQLYYRLHDHDGTARRIRQTYRTRGDAQRAYQEAGTQAAEGTLGQPTESTTTPTTLQQFVDAYLDHHQPLKAPRTLQRDRHGLAPFVAYIGPETLLDQIATHHIERWISARLAEVSPRTLLRDLSPIRHLFATAVRWKELPANPAAGIRLPHASPGRVVFLEPPDVARLLATAPGPADSAYPRIDVETPYLRPLLTTIVSCGLRPGEAFNMRWSWLDLDRRQLRIPCDESFTPKNKRPRTLGLTPQLVKELRAWRAWFPAQIAETRRRAGDPASTPSQRARASRRLDILLRCQPAPGQLVFPSFRAARDGDPIPLDNIKRSWRTALLAAFGEPTGEQDRRGNPIVELPERYQLAPYCLRHTFAVSLARAGVPLTKLKAAMGHAFLKTTEIYLRFAPEEGLDVADSLPSFAPETANIQEAADG
jgi:integrase